MYYTDISLLGNVPKVWSKEKDMTSVDGKQGTIYEGHKAAEKRKGWLSTATYSSVQQLWGYTRHSKGSSRGRETQNHIKGIRFNAEKNKTRSNNGEEY
ncbi:unnamed protein product [Rhodiola kirilowii]